MTPPNRPTHHIRNCPFCRIAMVASRTDEHATAFDQFHCLKCGTVVRFEESGSSPSERTS